MPSNYNHIIDSDTPNLLEYNKSKRFKKYSERNKWEKPLVVEQKVVGGGSTQLSYQDIWTYTKWMRFSAIVICKTIQIDTEKCWSW